MKSKKMRWLLAILASICMACTAACATLGGEESSSTQSDSSFSSALPNDTSSNDSSSSDATPEDSSSNDNNSEDSSSSDTTPDDSTPSIPVESISLNYTELRIEKGQQEELVATITPADATNKDVVWSSSNEGVATVVDGIVTAVGCGKATITVTTADGAKVAECEVTVYQSVWGVSLSVASLEMKPGESKQLTATISPIDATNQNVTWSVDGDCVTVDETGLVVALSAGEAVITVTTEDGNKEITCAVTVIQPVTGVELDITSGTLPIGGQLQLTVTIIPENASNTNVSWASSNEEILTVENGVVRGVGEGTAEIVVTTEDGEFSAVCEVTVLAVRMPSYMAIGQTLQNTSGATYTLLSGEALTAIADGVKATSTGVATVKMSTGAYEKEFNIKVIDFGNTTGTTFDLATDLSLWQYRNTNEDTDVTITYENNVGDGRATPYAFNALKYSRPQNNGEYRKTTGNLLYLDPEIISLAKELGYTTFSFEVLTKDNPSGKESTAFTMYNVKADGSLMWKGNNADNIIWKGHNTTIRWKRYNINLSDEKVFEGAGFGFGTYGQDLYLAKVEFSGADISEYAKSYLTESATAGQTEIASEELLQKMFTSVSNTSTLSFGTDAGEGYVKLTKSGYLSQNYLTYNQLKLSAEWIMAAKKLGYTRIRIGFDSTLSSYGTASVLRMGNDGKVYGANNKDSAYWTKTGDGGVTVDISKLEDGDSIVIACTGGELALRKIYFMTGSATLGYWNYDANMA